MGSSLLLPGSRLRGGFTGPVGAVFMPAHSATGRHGNLGDGQALSAFDYIESHSLRYSHLAQSPALPHLSPASCPPLMRLNLS